MSSLRFYFRTAKKIIGSENKKFSRPIVNLSIAGVASGIIIMLVAVIITSGYKQVIREKVSAMGAHIRVSNYDMNYSYEPAPFNSKQDFVEAIRSMDEVRSVQFYTTKSGVVKTADQVEGIVLKGVDKTFDTLFFQTNIVEGRQLSLYDTLAAKEIVVSRQMARKLGLQLGDKVRTYFVQDPPMQRSFTIVGIYETGLPEYDSQFAIVDLRHLQKLNRWDSTMVGGIEILLNDDSQLGNVSEQIDVLAGYQLKAETINEIFPDIFQWIALFDTNVIVLLVITFCVCVITMLSTFFIIVLEQISSIGILKTIGMRTRDVLCLFLTIAFKILLKGMLWGNGVAILLCASQKYWHWIKLDAATYYISFVPVSFNVPLIIAINIVVALLCLAVMAIPSYLVAQKTSPMESIRFD